MTVSDYIWLCASTHHSIYSMMIEFRQFSRMLFVRILEFWVLSHSNDLQFRRTQDNEPETCGAIVSQLNCSKFVLFVRPFYYPLVFLFSMSIRLLNGRWTCTGHWAPKAISTLGMGFLELLSVLQWIKLKSS